MPRRGSAERPWRESGRTPIVGRVADLPRRLGPDEPYGDRVTESPPLVYRISPVQVAVLILVAIPALAVNVYFSPSIPLRLVTLAFGLAALFAAYAGWRMYLVVDDEGIAVRRLGGETWLPWNRVAGLELVSGVRGSDTIRIHVVRGDDVDVPPSLLQPNRPTARIAARRRLQDTLHQIEDRRSVS
jgi:hypothetical protein